MNDDIVTRLRHIERLSEPVAGKYIPNAAKESADEIERLRQVNQLLDKMASDWEQTAKILALDLGHPEYAVEIYEDVQDGLYDKVRQRMLPETGGLSEIDVLKAEVAHWREFSQNLAMLGSISELDDYLKDE